MTGEQAEAASQAPQTSAPEEVDALASLKNDICKLAADERGDELASQLVLSSPQRAGICSKVHCLNGEAGREAVFVVLLCCQPVQDSHTLPVVLAAVIKPHLAVAAGYGAHMPWMRTTCYACALQLSPACRQLLHSLAATTLGIHLQDYSGL